MFSNQIERMANLVKQSLRLRAHVDPHSLPSSLQLTCNVAWHYRHFGGDNDQHHVGLNTLIPGGHDTVARGGWASSSLWLSWWRLQTIANLWLTWCNNWEWLIPQQRPSPAHCQCPSWGSNQQSWLIVLMTMSIIHYICHLLSTEKILGTIFFNMFPTITL